MDRRDRCHVACLANVAGDAVQDKQVMRAKPEAVECIGNYLARKREVLVLKKQALLEHASDKEQFFRKIGG